MQLTGRENANNVRNATCAASKTSKVPTQDALLFISYSMADMSSANGVMYLLKQPIDNISCNMSSMIL